MRKQVAAVVGVLVALTLAACGGGGPTGPTPAPVSVSVDRNSPVGVGEHICTTYRLSRPLSRAVEIWVESTNPYDGDNEPHTVPFPVGVADRRYTTGVDPATGRAGGVIVGDYTVRILGDRLPVGVVLGRLSSATTTVLPPPFASGVDCRNQR